MWNCEKCGGYSLIVPPVMIEKSKKYLKELHCGGFQAEDSKLCFTFHLIESKPLPISNENTNKND